MNSQESEGAIAQMEANSAEMANAARRELAEEIEREKAASEGREYIPPTEKKPEEEEDDKSSEDKDKEEEEKPSSEEEDGDKGEEEKPESEEKPEEEEEKPSEEDSEEDFEASIIKKYVDDTTMDEERAKEIVKQEKELAERYKVPYNKDTQELLKAKRHGDSKIGEQGAKLKEYEKQLNHIAKTKEYDIDFFIEAIENGKVPHPETGKLLTEDEVISLYEKYDPKLTDGMDSEKIKEMAARQLKAGYDKNRNQYLADIKNNAKAKRVEILENIPEYGKEFSTEIRERVKNISDDFIASDDFSIDYVVRDIRGGKAYDDLKQSIDKKVEEAYKAGQEDRKITAQKKGSGGAVSSGKSSVSDKEEKLGDSLSDDQKRIAEQKYGGMEPEEAYEAYADFLKEREKLIKKE